MSASNPPRYRPPLTRARPATTGRSKSARYSSCPYLGTEADPGTSLSYPTDANHCYRTRLPVPISGIHQENYCITDRYQGCPVYQQNLHLDEVALAPAPVTFYNDAMEPEALAAAAPAPATERGSNLRSVLAAALVLALLLGSWWVWRSFLADPDPNLALNTLQVEPTVAIAEQPPVGDDSVATAAGAAGAGATVGDAESEPTATALPPTPTAAPVEATGEPEDAGISLPELPPTATPLPTAEPEAEATVCDRTPLWWTPYVVQSGDTLDSLAERLGIDRDLIVGNNCLDTLVIVPGLTISLPPLGVVVEITPTVEATATAQSTPPPAATNAPVVGLPTLTATPFVLPSATPAATATSDQPENLATPPPPPTRQPTTVPPTLPAPSATVPASPTPAGPTATPPVLPVSTATATPPAPPGGGIPTATPPGRP